MAKEGQKFKKYDLNLKLEAVNLYLEGGIGFKRIAEQLGIRSKCQVRDWVKQYKETGTISDNRGKSSGNESGRRGRPKTNFSSLEEENAYLKAEVAYLKKRYPNLHGEEGF